MASLEGSGRKQEVARGKRARGRHASVLLARKEDDRGGSGGGLGLSRIAGPGGALGGLRVRGPGRLPLSPVFLLLSVF